MMKKSKMVDDIQKMVAGIDPDLKIEFDSSKELSGYRRGKPLTFGQLRKLCAGKKKPVVWVYCKKNFERAPRTNSAFIATYEDGYFCFNDGSSFGTDLQDEPRGRAGEFESWGFKEIDSAVKRRK